MSDRKNSTASDNSGPALGSSYRSPAPAGVTVKTMIERGHAYLVPKLYNVEITLMEIVRGEDAWEQIKDQGVSEQPKTGFEYILARINFGYFRRIRGGEDEPYKLPEGQFVAAAEDGVTEYGVPSVSQYPQPALVGYTFQPGESREGWILLQVPKDAKKPLLIYKRQHVEGMYGIWSYVWFQLF
jgi:hypothetical protein